MCVCVCVCICILHITLKNSRFSTLSLSLSLSLFLYQLANLKIRDFPSRGKSYDLVWESENLILWCEVIKAVHAARKAAAAAAAVLLLHEFLLVSTRAYYLIFQSLSAKINVSKQAYFHKNIASDIHMKMIDSLHAHTHTHKHRESQRFDYTLINRCDYVQKSKSSFLAHLPHMTTTTTRTTHILLTKIFCNILEIACSVCVCVCVFVPNSVVQQLIRCATLCDSISVTHKLCTITFGVFLDATKYYTWAVCKTLQRLWTPNKLKQWGR